MQSMDFCDVVIPPNIQLRVVKALGGTWSNSFHTHLGNQLVYKDTIG